MNKKMIIIVSVTCIVIVCVCLLVILFNNNDAQSNIKQEEKDGNVTVQSNEEKNEEQETQEEGGEPIVLESKIGIKILDKLVFSNIYSKLMYDELEKNGVSNDFKIMYTFSLMTNYQEYSHYLREAEDYTGSYITNDDLQKVASTVFADASNLKHKAIFEENTYDEATGDYVIIARGFAGSNIDYIVELPYSITEYSDRVEVKTYKLYLKRKYDMESQEALPVDEVYYDKNMTNLAISISDEKMLDEIYGQKDLLKSKIEEGKIIKKSLQIGTWTFEKTGADYMIVNYSAK